VSGYIEEGEMSAQAAVREVREEIGVEITPADLDFLGVHELFDIYRVEKWEGEPESKEKSILELKWFDIAELPYDQMHAGNSDWLPNFFKQS
jgi:8-oxo-dGTP diphosphatase